MSAPYVGQAVVIEAGVHADTPGVIHALRGARTVDVLTADGIVTVRLSSVELY